MTVTTDDLRDALADAAYAPYDAARVSRLQGVRAKVRQTRRRRAAAAATAGVLAVAAVTAGVVLGGASTSAPPAAPTSSRPPDATAALLPPLPWLYRGQDVVAQLTGSDDQTPAKRVELPAGSVGTVVVRCAAPAGRELPSGLQVELMALRSGAVDPEGTVLVPCLGAQEPQLSQLSQLLLARAGGTVAFYLRARFDRPVPKGTSFSVAALGGGDVVDLSGLRSVPKGYGFVGSYALSQGWVFASETATPGAGNGEQVVNDVQIALRGKRATHLLVKCVGALTLTADVGDGSTSSVTCPADQRATKVLDVPLRVSSQQWVKLRVDDAAPGALVMVGVSAR